MRVGLVGFSDSTRTAVPPTSDRAEVRDAVGGLAAYGGTATGDALQVALDSLTEAGPENPPSAIVLLSDGKRTAGIDPLTVAREAGQADVPIYTVALGTEEGTIESPTGVQSVPPDPETMAAVAEASGGDAFNVDDGDELSSVYERLGSQIGTRDEQREITVGFAAAGLALLAAAVLT